MKLRSIKYLTFEGLKNIWVNRLMSIASIGVLVACMIIIGIAIVLSLNVNVALGNLEQQNVVMVYFNDENSVKYKDIDNLLNSDTSEQSTSKSSNTQTSVAASSNSNDSDNTVSEDNSDSVSQDYVVKTEADALAICDQIRNLSNVATVEYISSEEGLNRMLDTMLEAQREYFSFLKDENPLSAGAKVTLKDLSIFDETVASIKGIRGVDEVYYQRDLAVKIASIKRGIAVGSFWIIGLLLVISLIIVANTIRVTMYNRKLEISIMKAIGATNSFIRLPFVIEGLVIGLFSAGITTGLLYFVYQAIIGTMKEALGIAQVVPFSSFICELSLLFCGIGILAGLLGSFFMINKYLRKEGSEFRAL
ncbi:MAG TPA: ABC transporter permease [Clostridiales bacterium]|nr:ABC transporter permease [Clostridiales bacterium]